MDIGYRQLGMTSKLFWSRLDSLNRAVEVSRQKDKSRNRLRHNLLG
jgi:hypothetical protein